jgi:transposase InsO family protein
MRILGVNGVRRGKRVRTTVPAKDGRRAGDLLDRDFTAPAPNRVWVADFSYVRTWLGFVYVAFIVDVFAQRIIAWHAATSKVTDLVMIPLRMALWQRTYEGHPAELGQLIHHSDAGSQYTSIRFTDHLDVEQIAPSIGSVGDAYDNALMESIIGLYKAECINTDIFHVGPYKSVGDVEYATEPPWIRRRVCGLRGLPVGGRGSSLPVMLFELNRWQVPDRGVQPVGVVPMGPTGDLPFDVSSAGPGRPGQVDRFGLEQADGRLAQRVVQRVADGADRAGDPGVDQFGGEGHRHVLRPRVGMMDQPRGDPPVLGAAADL